MRLTRNSGFAEQTGMTHINNKPIYLDEKKFNESLDTFREIMNKLGQLEDIEEELGIDLITLFKAQTNGFYVKTVCGIFPVLLGEWRFNLVKKEVHRIKFSSHYYFKDYGKTWALKKEELL